MIEILSAVTKYQFYVLLGFMVMACQKPPIDYNTAMSSCKIDTFSQHIGTGIMETYAYPSHCIVGAQLPDFSANTIEGKKIDKEYFTGKISIINFWFIGCHPCEAEMPGFNKLVEKYHSDPVNFLAISRNNPDDIRKFLTDHPFNTEQIADGYSITNDIFKTKWGYPLTIIADENLKIIHIQEGGVTDSTAIEKIQNQLSPVIDKALENM